MASQQPTAAPEPFVRLLRETIEEQGLSLREIGRRIGASTAYMSRLVHKQRGLPTDKTITKMEKALKIDQGTLLAAAGRHNPKAGKAIMNYKLRQLIYDLEPLTDEQLEKIVGKFLDVAKKYHPDEL
jgi:transcriptional regulator with XRE-family HTH domain